MPEQFKKNYMVATFMQLNFFSVSTCGRYDVTHQATPQQLWITSLFWGPFSLSRDWSTARPVRIIWLSYL